MGSQDHEPPIFSTKLHVYVHFFFWERNHELLDFNRGPQHIANHTNMVSSVSAKHYLKECF